MKKTIELALKAKGRTSPNPMVGALVVKDEKVIASGYHKKAGTPHAEVIALNKAASSARGATLYVNLEPCCHIEKRTPPCTKAIIESRIKRVVVGTLDPNPKVSGKGIDELRHSGIRVDVGVMEEEAKRLNMAFIKYITQSMPFVIMKVAQSLDGKIATASGESRWITGEKSRLMAHRLRNEVDAVMVGIGTVLKDDPALTTRIPDGRDPYRVIVDSSLRIPLSAKALIEPSKVIIAVTERAPQDKRDVLKEMGVDIIILKHEDGEVPLKSLMRELAKREILTLMIEGGSSINASALREGIVDKAMFFISSKIIGGKHSIASVGGIGPETLRDVVTLSDLKIRRIAEDVLIEGYTPFFDHWFYHR